PYGDGDCIAAACHDGLDTGFGFFYHRRLHVGATAWNVFAQLGFNPFTVVFIPRPPVVGNPRPTSTQLPAAGGTVTLRVDAGDNQQVTAVTATVRRRNDGQQWLVNCARESGTPDCGVWKGTFPAPANNTAADQVYEVTFVAQDNDPLHSEPS